MSPDLVLAALRFSRAAAAMFAFGACAYLALLVPEPLARRIAGRLDPLIRLAALVILLTSLAMAPVTAALLGEGWQDGLAPGALRAVLLETAAGGALLIQGAAALLLAVVTLVPAFRKLGLVAASGGLVLASLAAGGHAAMDGGAIGLAHRLCDILHLLSAGAWFGALAPMLAVLTALGIPGERTAAATALRRFSRVGHGAVALAIVSGLANAGFILGWPSFPPSPYEALLAGKLAVVAAMTALALLNRYGFVPGMALDEAGAIAAIRRGTIGEIALGLLAIGLVAIFGMLDPA